MDGEDLEMRERLVSEETHEDQLTRSSDQDDPTRTAEDLRAPEEPASEPADTGAVVDTGAGIAHVGGAPILAEPEQDNAACGFESPKQTVGSEVCGALKLIEEQHSDQTVCDYNVGSEEVSTIVSAQNEYEVCSAANTCDAEAENAYVGVEITEERDAGVGAVELTNHLVQVNATTLGDDELNVHTSDSCCRPPMEVEEAIEVPEVGDGTWYYDAKPHSLEAQEVGADPEPAANFSAELREASFLAGPAIERCACGEVEQEMEVEGIDNLPQDLEESAGLNAGVQQRSTDMEEESLTGGSEEEYRTCSDGVGRRVMEMEEDGVCAVAEEHPTCESKASGAAKHEQWMDDPMNMDVLRVPTPGRSSSGSTASVPIEYATC